MNNLESELDLAKYDAEDRSCMEEKKWKDTSSKELETGQNNEVLSTKKIKKRKRKKKKKSHNASEDKHIQEAGDMPCPDLTGNKKRKKKKKRHNASEDKHIQEAGDMPRPDLTSNKDIRKDDLNSVLDVAELESARIEKNHEVPSVNSSITERLSSFPKSLDACSIKKHGDHAEVDNSPENIKTYKRRKRAKTSRRKRSKVSDSLGNSLEPIKDDGGSSIQAVQSSSTRETSFDSSGEGTTMQVAEDISMEVASVNCSDGKPEAEESKKRMEVKNVEETGNEDGFVKDVAVLNITEQHFEQENRGKLDKIQIAVQDGIHVEEILDESPTCCKQKVFDNPSGCDHSHKHLEQKNVEIETKMEEIIPSMLHLGAIKDDVGLVVINNEDNSLKVSHSSPERAPIGCSNKKLLILDVNGLLADIVPYVPDGYKPDITISKKAVFKRPFCEEFLRFCFEKFCVGVWTSRTKRNVDRVLDFLMGDSKHNLLFCWDQFHCTDTGYNTIENRDKPLLLKELKKLWEKHEPDLPWEKGEYNESNTLLLDDSPYKALRNPAHTAIFPHSYRYRDTKDCSLGPRGDLRVYLEGLAAAENVQRYVEQYPFGQRAITESNLSWGFYRRIIGTDSDQPKDDASSSSTCQ